MKLRGFSGSASCLKHYAAMENARTNSLDETVDSSLVQPTLSRMKPGRDYIGISVAFWYTDGAGRFLFQKRGEGVRDEPGKWDLGGGQLEFDENLQSGVLRELSEEYGCAGEILAQLPAHDWIVGEGSSCRHWLIVPFLIKVDPSKVIVRETDKIAEVRWCALNEFPSPLHSGTRASLELCKSHLERQLK